MPLYEYYCTDCKSEFEALRPMSKADAEIQCKNCDSTRTSRVLSLFATLSGSASDRTAQANFGGGCCGGGSCGCGH